MRRDGAGFGEVGDFVDGIEGIKRVLEDKNI
jgi:hypothetical protein